MGRRKKFNRLPEAKQLAKQLLLHRVWHGYSQENIAEVLDVTFQQYQKIERCENRLYAEQLLAICKHFKWDPSIIMLTDPRATLDEWVENKSLLRRDGIVKKIESKLKRIFELGLSKFYKKN